MSKRKLRHPWLDPKDPANSKRLRASDQFPGFWVPTPEEIASQCDLLFEDHLFVLRNSLYDERRFARVDQVPLPLPPIRKELEETQLCDCPYWNTEFSETEQ